MGFFSSIGKALGSAAKAVGKVAGGVVKVAATTASSVLKVVPGVGRIYDAATSLVGVDPVQALGNTLSATVSGGNIGKDIISGLQEATSGGLVGLLFPSKISPGDSIPETSTDSPGVYTYPDGSYAYTVGVDGKVTYKPDDLTNPPAVAAETANGSLIPIPQTLGAKASYVQQLLNSYGDPLGVDKASMTMSAVNNYVSGTNPLDGQQQSNLIALDVVNQDPEALAYTAQALSQATGKNSVDWIAILTGLWNTAKNANIPGVSDAVKRVENQALNVATGIAEETATQKIGRFVKDNMLLIVGGVVALILLIAFLSGKRSRSY